MRLYLDDCKGAERTRVLTLITFLHKHAQAWILQKPHSERDSCQKIFNLLRRRFGIGDSPNDARLQFDVRKQEPNEKLDTFLDHLEALRIKAAPEESIKTRNLEIMRKFMTGLLDEDLHQSLLTSYTGEYYYTDNPPWVEQKRSKCHDHLTLRRVNSNRRKAHAEQLTGNNKPIVPTNWTTPKVQQNKSWQNAWHTQITNQTSNVQIQSGSHARNQIQNNTNFKPLFDKSQFRCFACGEMGRVHKECANYRKALCKMGYAPPDHINDPDEITKYYKAVIRVAPLHCFHCLRGGHIKPNCPHLKRPTGTQPTNAPPSAKPVDGG